MNCRTVFNANITFFKLDIGNIFKQGGTADDAKSSIETFNNKWGDRDFGGALRIPF
jgi:hypothetical protein